MDDSLLGIFERELEMQCRLILIGADELDDAQAGFAEQNDVLMQWKETRKSILAASGRIATWNIPPRPPDGRREVDRMWFALQGILVSAANASKLLWGSKKAVGAARLPLRESVQVDKSSPLYDRDLRNDFEHFDERIEEWFVKGTQRTYVGRSIGPRGGVYEDNGPIEKVFGHFEPRSSTVTFWAHLVELVPLIEEAGRVLSILQEPRRGWPRA